MPAFDSGKNFFNLPVVWITGGVLVVSAALISWAIYDYENLIFCRSSDCFNYFVVAFKVPLGVLALIIPIGAVYAVNHRSAISIEQMRLSSEQNKFSNYYKHKEEFSAFIKKNAGGADFPDQVHRLFYGDINKWTGKANTQFVTNRIWSGMAGLIAPYQRLQMTTRKDTEERLEIMYLIAGNCTILNQEFVMGSVVMPHVLNYKGNHISMPDFTIFAPLIQFSYTVSVLRSAVSFDTDLKDLKMWEPIANERFDLPKIPFTSNDINLYISDEKAFKDFDFNGMWDRVNNFKFQK
ncbi:hypothetical protein [Paraglaciecola polaris]|uniref:Uncharacterized protein n=1 Tax=Paraglaciecola polaris LMG 21857 TaxID=1129793 RepID=K6YKF5_9ALTE|nr:hypothetical protein [Paraglaciecola polaris]GAC33194.1 hypothetical protein GPLA_2289 [Paraglaciecola polaris LMG 21857]